MALNLKKNLFLSLFTFSVIVPALGFAATDDNNVTRASFTTARVWNLEANTIYLGLNGSIEEITSSTDRDYILVMCRGTTVKSAGISYQASKGDLDIKVYDLAGNYLGESKTKESVDQVDISSKGLKAVVMRVEGYNGATNGYNPEVDCQAPPNPRAVATGG